MKIRALLLGLSLIAATTPAAASSGLTWMFVMVQGKPL